VAAARCVVGPLERSPAEAPEGAPRPHKVSAVLSFWTSETVAAGVTATAHGACGPEVAKPNGGPATAGVATKGDDEANHRPPKALERWVHQRATASRFWKRAQQQLQTPLPTDAFAGHSAAFCFSIGHAPYLFA